MNERFADRVLQTNTSCVLLPHRCRTRSGYISSVELKRVLASTKHHTLFTGQTGTGKEALADCAFYLSNRPPAKCQRLNCAGLESNLVASELFGHKKGAYTGADTDRHGLLRTCDGGLLFLDEIGWMPRDIQARLLRFMETGEIRPLGADRVEAHAHVRLLAATNQDPASCLLPDLRFRFDFEVSQPSLYERSTDIFWFMCQPSFLATNRVFTGITLRTLIALISTPWTGNIRELSKYFQRKALLHDPASLPPALRHVLDDPTVIPPEKLASWTAMCSAALCEAESFLKKLNPPATRTSQHHLLSLLAMIASTPNVTPGVASEQLQQSIISTQNLNQLVGDGVPGLGPFQHGLLEALLSAPTARNPFDPTVVPPCNSLDLLEALIDLRDFLPIFATSTRNANTALELRNNVICRTEWAPSKHFLTSLLTNPLDGLVFGAPQEPDDQPTLTEVLDALAINQPDRSICELCAAGFSNKVIATRLSLGTSTIAEHLNKLRSAFPSLVPHLPRKQAGRKRQNPSPN